MQKIFLANNHGKVVAGFGTGVPRSPVESVRGNPLAWHGMAMVRGVTLCRSRQIRVEKRVHEFPS